MITTFVALVYIAASGIGTGSAESEALTLDCRDDRTERAVVGARNGLSVRVNGSNRIWLEIDENGRALNVTGARAAVSLSSPPRLAREGFWMEPGSPAIDVRDAANIRAPVSARIRVYCANAGVRATSMEALGAAGGLASPDHALAAIEGAPADADVRAYATHLSAQSQLVTHRSADAAKAFKRAERAWQSAGDPARALAARVAWAEEAYQLGRYQEAIDAGSKLPARSTGAIEYYAGRLANNRCVALRSLGRFDDAMRCYEALVDRLASASEPLDLAGVLLNLAALQRDSGRLAAMETSLSAAERELSAEAVKHMPPVDVAVMSGRVRLMRAELALHHGAIGSAMADYDAALSSFKAGKANRWHANTLMQMAALFGRVGEYGDAYALWTQAFASYSAAEAPARIANALMILARLERGDGNPKIAAWLAREAALRFVQLNAVAEPQAARLDEVRALLDAGAVAQAADVMRTLDDVVPRHRVASSLARASLALAQDEPDAAARALDAVPPRLSMNDEIDRNVLRAMSLAARGDQAAALRLLVESLALIDAAADSSSNLLLRDLLQRRGDPLRRAALSLLLSPDDSRSNIEAILPLMPVVQPRTTHASGKPSGIADIDTLFARELLFAADGAAASSTLPALLADAATQAQARTPVRASLHGIQAGLRVGDAVLAILDTGDRAAALWIMENSTSLRPIAPPAELRERARALAESLRDRDSAGADLDAKARAMADAVWPGGSLPRGLARLYVVADPLASAITWSVLPDAEGVPLLESTDVSLVHLSTGAAGYAPSPPSRIHVAIAAQERPADPVLAPLEGATLESDTLSAALPAMPLQVLDASEAPVKAKLLDALARPGAWVHVAAHGTTRSGYLGRSGLWLTPGAPDRLPEFFSVLDLYEMGARADLVVLNACELASRDSRSANAPGFADTLVRLGARNVVAASWPIADLAAASWIETFYRTLASGDVAPAHALRIAQQGLANSRPYRHPYYWASLVHLGVLPAGDPIGTPSSQGAPP